MYERWLMFSERAILNKTHTFNEDGILMLLSVNVPTLKITYSSPRVEPLSCGCTSQKLTVLMHVHLHQPRLNNKVYA
jgi:hypothetical protein